MTNTTNNDINAEIMTRTARGARVTHSQDGFVTLAEGKPVNHVLHLILTVLTIGFWSWIWLALTAFTGERQVSIHANPYGSLSIVKSPWPIHRYIALALCIADLVFWFGILVAIASASGHH